MAGLTYRQKEQITRLRGAENSPGEIAARLGLDEAAVLSALRWRKLRGFLGLAGIIGFFAAIIVTPLLNEEQLEGKPITDPALIDASLHGQWEGYWLSRGHKRPLRIWFAKNSTDTWSLKVNADDENCPGNGDYSGSGTVSAEGISAKLVSAHPDCGELDIVYAMAVGNDGKPQMKGRFLRMPTGDVGSHFVTRN